MGTMRKWLLLCCVLGMVVSGQASAFDAPPIPDKPESEIFKDAPAPWRDYLVKVRAAERIADPLQRCLAFPDLPGTQWPQGHAEAHCRYHLDDRRVTPAQIDAMLDAGELDKLERLMDAHLALHFDQKNYSEVIHLDLDFGKDNADINSKVAQKWLKAAPDSTYANTAYAFALLDIAWKIRGGKYDSATPDDNLLGKDVVATSAIPYFQKAIAINPKLMPAYHGLMNVARISSLDDLRQSVSAAARKVDPDCAEFVSETMYSLAPRWGGSYEEMFAYASELSGHVAERPMLAAYVSRPYVDRGDRLEAAGRYDQTTIDLLEEAVKIGSDEDALQDAALAMLNVQGAKPEDGYEALAYLLQASRFKQAQAWATAQIGLRLSLASSEPEWSMKYAALAIAQAPDDMGVRYNVAATLQNLGRLDEAQQQFDAVIAGNDAQLRHDAIRSVAEFRLWSGDVRQPDVRKTNAAKARPYIDRLLREYPDDGRGAIMNFWANAYASQRIDAPAMRAVLAKVDRTDPWQADRARNLDAMLQHIDQAHKPSPHP